MFTKFVVAAVVRCQHFFRLCCRSLPAFRSLLSFRYFRMGATLYGVLRTTPFTGVTRPSGWASISVRPAAVRRQRGALLSLVYCFVGSLIPGTLFCKPSALGTQRRHFLRRRLSRRAFDRVLLFFFALGFDYIFGGLACLGRVFWPTSVASRWRHFTRRGGATLTSVYIDIS